MTLVAVTLPTVARTSASVFARLTLWMGTTASQVYTRIRLNQRTKDIIINNKVCDVSHARSGVSGGQEVDR